MDRLRCIQLGAEYEGDGPLIQGILRSDEAATSPVRPIQLSVIIPCYNEQKNLEAGVLEEVRDFMITQPYGWEIIIVDDGSTDQSLALVEPFVSASEDVFLFPIPHGTKPAAIRRGIEEARGDYVLFTDMDQSTPISEIVRLLPWVDEGYDVVIGSRGLSREGFSILRRIGSVVFRLMRSIFLLRDIKDTQCGFKLFRRDIVARLFPRLQFFRESRARDISGWKVTAYDVELLHLFRKAGYDIKEVSVKWHNRDLSDTKGRDSEAARYIRESLDMVGQILRVSVNDLRGYYQDL